MSADPPPPPCPSHPQPVAGKVALSDLAGVHPGDAASSGAPHLRRDKPRLTLTAKHAMAIIMLLMAALCTSLTMLVQQASHIEHLQGASSQLASDQTSPMKGGGDTGNSVSGNNEGESVGGESAGADSPDPSAGTGTPDPPATAPHPDDGLVDLNTAGLNELDAIKGIGPVLAQRILDYRASIGRFTSVDQLLEVKGIGAKTLESLRSQVTVR